MVSLKPKVNRIRQNPKPVNPKKVKAVILNLERIKKIEEHYGIKGLANKIAEVKKMKIDENHFEPAKSTINYLMDWRRVNLSISKSFNSRVKSVIFRGAEVKARPEELLLAGYSPAEVATGLLAFKRIVQEGEQKLREENSFAIAFSKDRHQFPNLKK